MIYSTILHRMSTQPQCTKPEEEKTYKCSDCDAWVKPSESCCGSDEEESYIKKDGSFCHGCRTGGNEKCLCEDEEPVCPECGREGYGMACEECEECGGWNGTGGGDCKCECNEKKLV